MKPEDLERATKSMLHHYRTPPRPVGERRYPPKRLKQHEKEYFAQLDQARDDNIDAMLDEYHEVIRINR